VPAPVRFNAPVDGTEARKIKRQIYGPVGFDDLWPRGPAGSTGHRAELADKENGRLASKRLH
jgi:hypothetical protein